MFQGALECLLCALPLQGDLDTTTPMAMAQFYAASIPGATLHLLRGEGHLSLPFRHNRRILGSITDAAKL